MRALAVVGNVNLDIIVGPLSPWPEPGTESVVAHDEVRPGGAAGNVALAWQALGVPFQAGATVGTDLFGRSLREAFGVAALRWPAAEARTTFSIGITHPSGERTFVTTRGHLETFSVEDALSGLEGAALEGGILLVCGSFVTPRIAAAYDALFDWAEEHGIDAALDTGWPPGGWSGAVVEQARRWVARCRHLLLNEIETAALAGTSDAEEGARNLVRTMCGDAVAVVKRGGKGALACPEDGETIRVPAGEVAVVDTIGAGDAFNAGYLAAVAKGEPTARALRHGVETASAAISTSPRRYRLPAAASKKQHA